ncbi:hypothetical protein QEG73_15425 [Chitinophagaceae bacterium 26-R-25]|nr:hypothetical protein [Chitinophagaceae bacterium 26-R-25]
MNDFASTNDHLSGIEEPKKLPSTLNVLTILTFIWSGITILSSFYSFATAKSGYEKLEKMQGSPELENAPEFVKKMTGPEMLEVSRKSMENRVPILLVALIATGLCIYGAVQMRKLLKQGYYVWLIGEVLPIITTFIFIGAGAFSPFFLFFLIFPVVFIILYGTQLKHMH